MRYKNYIALIMMTFAVIGANAQSVLADSTQATITRDVDVQGTYLPTIINPTKLQVDPNIGVEKPEYAKVDYQMIPKVTDVKTAPDSLTAAKMQFMPKQSLYNTLVKLDAGSADVRARLLYNINQSEKYQLSLDLGHQSSYGKVKDCDDNKISAPVHNTWAGVDFGTYFDFGKLGASARFDNSLYRYYGCCYMEPDKYFTYVQSLVEGADTVFAKGSELLAEERARQTRFDIGVNFGNPNALVREKVSYFGELRYNMFTNKQGVAQSGFNVGGWVRFPIKENYLFDINVHVNQFRVSTPDNKKEAPYYQFEDRKHVDVPVNPHFGIDFDAIQLRLGLNMIFEVGGEQDNIYMQPDIWADWSISGGIVRLYAGITGGYKANSYADLMKENPYLSADAINYVWSAQEGIFGLQTEMKTTQKPIDFAAGIKIAFSKSVQMNAGIEYGSFDDELFFVNKAYHRADSATHVAMPEVGYVNRFALITDNGKLFKASADLKIVAGKKVDMLLNANYFKYKMDYIERAWYKPEFTVGFEANVYPTAKLKFGLNANVVGKRYALDMSTGESVKLGVLPHVCIDARYKFTDRLNFYAEVNNLAARDAEMYLGYHSIRFSANVGASYRF